METLGLSSSTPIPRSRLRELFWPIIDSDVAARTAARNAMYACLVIGVLNLVLPMVGGGNRLSAILTCSFYIFAAFGIRSFSWVAAISALGIFGLGLIISTVTLGVFVGVVGFIFFGLLIGGVRAVSFASRWRKDHPGEDIRDEPLDGLGPLERFFARLPLAFWPWARPLFVAYLALYALLLIALVNSAVFVGIIRADSISMEPGISYGDDVIALKAWVMGPLQRGDLVVFRVPHARLRYEVSRIVGVPGDRVRLRDKQLILDGRVVNEPYVEHIADERDEYRDNFPSGIDTFPGMDMMKANIRGGEIVVPGGFYFTLDDSRDNAVDGRYIGFIPRDCVIGRPMWVSGAKRGFRVLPRIRLGNRPGAAPHTQGRGPTPTTVRASR